MASDIVILENKIAELDVKISAFIDNSISEVKRNRLIAKKERYEQQLADLQA